MLQIVEDENLTSNIDLLPNVDTSQVYALKDCFGKFEQNLINFRVIIFFTVLHFLHFELET